MTIEQDKETLCINQIIGQKEEQLIIEEDFVVPDIKPDILNAINTNGNVCIYKKEIMDGKIKVEGCVNSYIMYLADTEESQLRSLNNNLDFSQIIDFENIKVGMIADTSFEIKQIECRVLNGRKINVRAILDVKIKAYSNENMQFIKEINNISDVQLLKKEMNINSLLGIGNTKVYAKETLMIDTVDELAEILKFNVDIKNKETKISYNKVLIKADCCTKIMYLTTDGRICCKDEIIPIMGFIDIQDVADDSICDVQYEIKNILVKPNSQEEHSIYVEIEIEAYCRTYTNDSIEVIQDLYSPTINLNYEQSVVRTMSKKSIYKDKCSIREKQIIEDLTNNKIIDIDVRPYIQSENISDGKIMYKGEVGLKFIFEEDGISNINVKEINIPFEYNMECIGINEKSKINTSLEVMMQDFVVMPDGSIDVKIDIGFDVNSFINENINLIREINVEENRDESKYSLVIYYTKKEDTLWQIAKKFKSTIEDIMAINQMEDDSNIGIGRQLFIPMIR